jgi:2-methylisocitrate lyase-like PEP mutase family enzyme
MKRPPQEQAKTFRELHARDRLLRLPNAWDAGSARLFEANGAEAIATTSAGLAWSCGHPDGDALPVRVHAAAVAAIARVVSIPISADSEGGYSDDPRAVGRTIALLIDAGAVGINLEDGTGSADLLCAKIEAVRAEAERARVDLFVNARTDVFLKGLVPADRALDETLARGRRYRDAGADGFFVPRLVDPAAIRTVAAEIALPLNLLVGPGLPPIAELERLGVRRVSAGSGLASAAYGAALAAEKAFLGDGDYRGLVERTLPYGVMNELLKG